MLPPLPPTATLTTQYTRGILGAAPSCGRCPLREQTVVPPEGNRRARIALVGEGPGHDEVVYGRPFIGPSGALLNRLLHAAGLTRDEVWLTNSTLCPPRAARYAPDGEHWVMLNADEAKQTAARYCRYRLATELHTMRDTLRTIVPIGKIALDAVTFARRSIQARRGSVAVLDLDSFVERAYQDIARLHGAPAPALVLTHAGADQREAMDPLATARQRAARVVRAVQAASVGGGQEPP